MRSLRTLHLVDTSPPYGRLKHSQSQQRVPRQAQTATKLAHFLNSLTTLQNLEKYGIHTKVIDKVWHASLQTEGFNPIASQQITDGPATFGLLVG